MNIKNIIFDFGRVVMDWDPRYFFQSYFNDDENGIFLKEISLPVEWNAEQDHGRSVASETMLLISKHQNGKKRYWHIMKTGTSCCVQTFQKT